MYKTENEHGMYYDETIPGYFGDGHDHDDPLNNISVGQRYWTIIEPDLGGGWHSIVHVRVDKFLVDNASLLECSLIKLDKPSISEILGPFTNELYDNYHEVHYGKWPKKIKAWLLFETPEEALKHIISCYQRSIDSIKISIQDGVYNDMPEDGLILVCPPLIDTQILSSENCAARVPTQQTEDNQRQTKENT